MLFDYPDIGPGRREHHHELRPLLHLPQQHPYLKPAEIDLDISDYPIVPVPYRDLVMK